MGMVRHKYSQNEKKGGKYFKKGLNYYIVRFSLWQFFRGEGKGGGGIL